MNHASHFLYYMFFGLDKQSHSWDRLYLLVKVPCFFHKYWLHHNYPSCSSQKNENHFYLSCNFKYVKLPLIYPIIPSSLQLYMSRISFLLKFWPELVRFNLLSTVVMIYLKHRFDSVTFCWKNLLRSYLLRCVALSSYLLQCVALDLYHGIRGSGPSCHYLLFCLFLCQMPSFVHVVVFCLKCAPFTSSSGILLSRFNSSL